MTSFAPITSATSVCGELRVDLVHLLELVVRHVRLGEQHVHVARHAAGDGMDRVLDVDALLLEQLRELRARRAAPARPRARSPGRRRPCARTTSCTATSSGVVARTVRPSSARMPVPAPACTWPKAPNRTFVTERFIAFAISSVSSVPEAPTSMPATISTVL